MGLFLYTKEEVCRGAKTFYFLIIHIMLDHILSPTVNAVRLHIQPPAPFLFTLGWLSFIADETFFPKRFPEML